MITAFAPRTFAYGLAAGYPANKWATIEEVAGHKRVVVWESTHYIDDGPRLVQPTPEKQCYLIQTQDRNRATCSLPEHVVLALELEAPILLTKPNIKELLLLAQPMRKSNVARTAKSPSNSVNP